MANNVLENMDLRSLGKLLRQGRERQGMTLENAANTINVTEATVAAIERGDHHIKAGELIKLARAYKQSISDLICPTPAFGSVQQMVVSLDQGLITEGQFARQLGVNRLDARYIAEAWRGREV